MLSTVTNVSVLVSALPLLLFPGYLFVSRLLSYFHFSKSEPASQWTDALLSISVSLSLGLSLLCSSSVLLTPLSLQLESHSVDHI